MPDAEGVTSKYATFILPDDGSSSSEIQVNERRITRKLDLFVLCLLFFLYFFCTIDKSNIANAKLGGLEEDLGLTPLQYRWCISILFVGLVVFVIPSNIILRRWHVGAWIGTMAIAWGTISLCMTATTNFAGLVVCRFWMGMVEAGYLSAAEYVMSVCYPRRQYGSRLSILGSSGSLSSAFGGLIAYGVAHIPTDKLNTWQWLFIIESIPSILLGFLALWYLPDSAGTARFLTADEQKYQIQRLADDQGSTNFEMPWSWEEAMSVLKDWKIYVYSYIMLAWFSASSGFGLALPSIIDGMGDWSPAVSQALTAPPNLIACIIGIAVGYSSDRFFERGIHGLVFSLVGLAGLFMLMFLPEEQLGARYFAICVTSSGSNGCAAALGSWTANNYGSLTRRVMAIGMVGTIGHIGGVVGGQMYFDAPRYLYGSTIAVCMVVSVCVAILGLRFMLARENKRRDAMSQQEKQRIIEKYNIQETADDRHPDFRYIL